MAVTNTLTAPSTATTRTFTGSYGPSGASNKVWDVGNESFARKRVKLTKLVLSGTYATNGFALTPSTYGLAEIHDMAVLADGKSGGAAVPYLSTTGASPVVKLVTDNVPTELADTTSVTNHSYTVLLIGV